MCALPESEHTVALGVASSGGDKQACLPHPGLPALGQNLGWVGNEGVVSGDCLGLEDEWFRQFN